MPLVAYSATRRFRDQVALDGVTISVRDGDCYGLIGHNGAGKTTLLRIMLGLMRGQDETRVVVDGFDVARYPREARARMGGLIEVPGFYGSLSGRRNLEMLARLGGLSSRDARREAERMLELTDLAHAGGKPVQAYSHGMRQRLGIAQAMLGSPAYLLLDEPTNGLDPQGIAELRELLRRLNRDNGLTIVVSSHQLHQLSDLCNRVAVLHRGRRLVESETAALLGAAGGPWQIRTDDDASARRLLEEAGYECRAEEGAGLLAEPGEADPADLAERLVHDGRRLHTFAQRAVTLEQIYLRYTSAAEQGDTPETSLSVEPAPAPDARPAERRAPRFPLGLAFRHEMVRWFGRPGPSFALAAPCLLAMLAVLRRSVRAREASGAVEESTVYSTTDVTAFEAAGLALQASIPLLALVLAGLASQSLAGELSRGTLRNLLLRPIGRWRWALGKALACLLAGALATLALLGVALAAAGVAFDYTDVVEILPNGARFPLVPAEELWPELRLALLSPLLPIAAITAIGFAAGSIARSSAGALALALGAVVTLDLGRAFGRSLDVEGWLPSALVPSPLGDTSFFSYFNDIAVGVSNAVFEYGNYAVSTPLLWCAGCLGLAALILRYRSIP